MAKVKVPVHTIMETELHPVDAFRILCNVLDMNYVLNEFVTFAVRENEKGEKCVYRIHSDGEEELYDERGDLFVALRNTALCICPNLGFRDDDYIYKN